MDFVKKKLLTIITESDLEERIIGDIGSLGAKGYTITQVNGKGQKGLRNADWSANSNIKIEIICKNDISKKIIQFMQKNYIKNYAMILYTSEVEVICN
jgi:nitrogen regulatory protein PII